MKPDERAAVEQAEREAAARRRAVLSLSKSERLRLLSELCRQSAVLPQRGSRT